MQEKTEPKLEDMKLGDIKGLGEKRVSDLKESGVNNLSDLAKADIEELAEKTGFSEKHLAEWQKAAKSKLPDVAEEKPATEDKKRFSDEEAVIWAPQTKLGQMVRSGQIKDINEVFEKGHVIKEVGIVNTLLPELQEEIINVGRVQRVTDSGRRMRFRVVTAVGNGNGFIGVGEAKGKEAGPTIRKAIERAKLNIHPIKRGCGSWECGCGNPHTVPFTVSGKAGSVRAELMPAPRGVGLVAGELPKKILSLAGITDVWLRSDGHTRTSLNFAHAVYKALVNTNKVKVKDSDTGQLNIISGAVEQKTEAGEADE